tara:strand:+ start:235 stop:483 length:249 start_codon:yes stop_codon:yes gene_type:complete
MSGKIGKYTYKNESVLKEFISSLFKALGSRKGKQIQKQLRKDPEMRKVMDRVDKANKDAEAEMTKRRKKDSDYDAHLKSMGL